MPRKGSNKTAPAKARAKIEKTVASGTPAPFDYDVRQAGRLAALSHAISIGKEAGLAQRAWIPHILQAIGGYTVEQAKKFYPEGDFQAEKIEQTKAEEPVTAESAAASI